ncbi:MAG: hypothetical protein AAF125_12050 [Chloroflexota bacterium]
MAELPFELQKLPPSALDVLRYFGENGNEPSGEDTLVDATGLSNRSLGKAIKRLVTRKFAEMDINRHYTLTDKGKQLMQELLAYDAENGGASSQSSSSTPAPARTEPVERRFSVVVPNPFTANETVTVYVGLEDGLPSGDTELVLQLSALNADLPSSRVSLPVKQGPAYASFQVTPGEFTQMRLRMELLQPDKFSGDIHNLGGMHVDADVSNNAGEAGGLSAYGTDVRILP